MEAASVCASPLLQLTTAHSFMQFCLGRLSPCICTLYCQVCPANYYLFNRIDSFSGVFSNFDAVAHEATDKVPPHIRTATLDLASNHLICSVALTGVLALQAGRHWAESADDDERLAELSSEPRSRARTPGP